MLKSKKKRRGGVVALGADRDAPAVQHHKPAHHEEHERLNLDGTRHQSSKDLAAQRPKVRHDHSPLDYVEFTHPDKRIGNIDVWVAWRHDPEFMYKLPPGSDADPFPGLEPNELTITVIRAKRLLAVDTSLLGGTSSSDPMVAIKLGAGPEQRTQSVKKNLYPAWQETFYLKDDKSGDDVDVVVYDVDAKVVSDETREFMGQCKVNLAKHRDFRGRCVRHWYQLVGEDGKADLDRGTLELFTAFRHNPDLAVVDVPEEHAVDPHIGTEDPNEVGIVLIRAKNLKDGGGRGTILGGSANVKRVNPYVKSYVGTWEPKRSDVKEGTASPVWVETYAFECDDWNADICFEVYDKNAIANRPDELLGTLTIPVKSLSSRKPLRKWCRLADKSGKPSIGRTSTPAANYRRALSLLPLHGGDARDDATKKRRLIEQHFIRAAGHNVAKRLIRGGAGRESQLPPPGKRRFDGSGFVYPADTPDPRRPPATYPDTLASLCRTAAGIRTRDFYVTGDPTLLPPNVLL